MNAETKWRKENNMSYFIYNGISSEDMGLKITSMTPPQKAEQRSETLIVPGRSEPVFKTYDEYSSYNIDISCIITDNSQQRKIFSWLSGNGKFIRSDEPDKYYTAKSCSLISSTRISAEIREFSISFECMPFAYAIENEPVIIMDSEGAIDNNGSIPCEPVITVEGNGYIELNVNGEVWKLTDIDGSITIDTPRNLAYKDNNVLLSKISRYDNNVYLPMLNVGTNSISVSGDVSKISVTKNERWL